jgi:long-chain acyl-CoA synthetase
MRESRLLHDSLAAAALAAPEKPALVVDGQRLSYAELLGSARRFATALQELGLERGDRVILTDSEASFLVTEGTIARVAGQARERAPSLRATIKAGEGELDGMLSFEELLEGAEPEPRDPGTIPFDLAALIYTSGSTGNPKGVMMTHANMVFAAGSLSEYLRLGPEHRIMDVLPLAFDYGLYQLLMSVRMQATLVLERTVVNPAQVLKRLEEEAVTVFPGVPTVY